VFALAKPALVLE